MHFFCRRLAMAVLRRIILVTICGALMFVGNWSLGQGLGDEGSRLKLLPEPTIQIEPTDIVMHTAIEKLESQFLSAEESTKLGIMPLEDIEEQYFNIIGIINEITEVVKDSKNADIFLKAKGLNRVVAPYLTNQYPEVKTKLIILLKVLFDIEPATTNALIPTKILDHLLNIFENDNLALKAHSLDVLAKWMPDNPKIQTRVMKLKGLEPFYNQVNKLDVSGIRILLDLFNKILKEHITFNKSKQTTQFDAEKYVMYRKIGLVERMSTPLVCNGFLNIFEILWSFNNNEDNEVVESILNLIQNIEPFCMNVFKGRPKAIHLFEALLNYVQDENKQHIFKKIDRNMTEFEEKLRGCIATLKSYRDEL